MFYFQTNTLGFTPEFLGRVRLAGALASLAGVGVYNFALKDVPLRKMFLWTAIVGTALGGTQVMLITGGIHSHVSLKCTMRMLWACSFRSGEHAPRTLLTRPATETQATSARCSGLPNPGHQHYCSKGMRPEIRG